MRPALQPIIATLVCAVCFSGCRENGPLHIRVTNPQGVAREDGALLLTRDMLPARKIPPGLSPVLTGMDGDPVPCQADDRDGDGSWDELFGLIDLGPRESRILTVRFTPDEAYPAFETRTNIRLGANEAGYPERTEAKRLRGVSYHNYGGRTSAEYQMEGPAWENDHVGFRNYLDQRNGMDIFGKRTRRMVLDSVGVEGRRSYHEPNTWGMDILKVGTSLGAGGIACIYRDSLYRVGDNGRGTYRLLYEGSQRSSFLLSYDNWRVDSLSLHVNHRIGITGGRHCYESTVTLSGFNQPLSLAPGIVTMKSDTAYTLELNDNFLALVTAGPQAEDSTRLTMVLMMPRSSCRRSGTAPETGPGITQTYYAVLPLTEGVPVSYRFYSLWEEEDPRWADPAQVEAFLYREAGKWSLPVEVTLLRPRGT